jgi:acetyl esterase/lipase
MPAPPAYTGRRMKAHPSLLACSFLVCATLCLAQTPPTPGASAGSPTPAPTPAAARGGVASWEPRTFPLWENGAPGALGTEPADTPTLTYYPANGRGAGTAVIVVPGGGYVNLAMNHEGRQVANWLNSLGVSALVLKHRLGPRYRHPIELGDAQRAIRLVRSRASEFGTTPERIGMLGFSAGGHLAATAGTHFDAGKPDAADSIDRVSSRPSFLVLAYPVILSRAPYAHQGSFNALLGANPDPALLDDLSLDQRVTKETPPTFLFHTNADTGVPAENSVQFYLALRKAGVPAEIHIFQPGAHGVGLGMGDAVLEAWPPLLSTWLRNNGLLTNPTPPPARGGAAPAASTPPVPAAPKAP